MKSHSKPRIGAIVLALGLLSLHAAEPGAPRVTNVSTVAPDILAISIETGQVEQGLQVPYSPQAGDEIDAPKAYGSRIVRRDGKAIGALVGKDGKTFMPFDHFEGGADFIPDWADDPAAYRLASSNDLAFSKPRLPFAVARKSKPTGLARVGNWAFHMPVKHVIFMKFDDPIRAKRTYTLSFEENQLPSYTFLHDPFENRSEAVHVSHIGFHPDDPVKTAFLSCWMGGGGSFSYDPDLNFHIIDQSTQRSVYSATIQLAKAAEDATEDPYDRNYNGTDVYRLDFPGLNTPGEYRVYVERIGCSYPFTISTQVWDKAFIVAARGLYHQRSGTALGPPRTPFERPRCFHPDDGLTVLHSDCTLMDSGNGLNARGTDKGNFANLVASMTDGVVSNAWGGYFDAGDWDRRIQHLQATRLLFELAEMFPDLAESTRFIIPESDNNLPDLLDEALWNMAFFRRLQTEDGGVRGGIESAGHPRLGEGSWQESLPVMAYAPGIWSSYEYAGVAARTAYCLRRFGFAESVGYHESALRAMNWAENEYKKDQTRRFPHAVKDSRNLAAAELYRLSGTKRWHDVFLSTTVFTKESNEIFEWRHHSQRDAAFVYARTSHRDARADVRNNAFRAIVREADTSVALGKLTAFGWTKLNPWQPIGSGTFSTPQVTTILRAHYLTRRSEYIKAALLACQTGAGANPVNICYTTGIGYDWPRHPLWIDARVLGKPPPAGLTVYGPTDTLYHKDHWAFKIIERALYPPPIEWPSIEAYFDVHLFPAVCEFTVHQTLGPNVYAWGYLAGCGR